MLAAGAVAAAAAWLIRRTKQGDERRERAGSIAYDTKDELFHAMRKDAITAASREPWMAGILQHIIDARSFEDAVANMLMHKLAYETTNKQEMRRKFREALLVESVACRADAQAVVQRDPAADGVLDVVMYFKGFSAIQGYRIAHRAWEAGERAYALWLQSRCSQQFGVDIHPAAVIGPAVIIDHATGVVIGVEIESLLHAIDATPARWRSGAGSSPLDGASTAASSCTRHWLISTQLATGAQSSDLSATAFSSARGTVYRTSRLL